MNITKFVATHAFVTFINKSRETRISSFVKQEVIMSHDDERNMT